jgi:uncharacterized membrane protein
MRISNRKRGGMAVLLTSVTVVGAMTVIGLAVDVGMMYAVKVKLSAAADAASLAAAPPRPKPISPPTTRQATCFRPTRA